MVGTWGDKVWLVAGATMTATNVALNNTSLEHIAAPL